MAHEKIYIGKQKTLYIKNGIAFVVFAFIARPVRAYCKVNKLIFNQSSTQRAPNSRVYVCVIANYVARILAGFMRNEDTSVDINSLEFIL